MRDRSSVVADGPFFVKGAVVATWVKFTKTDAADIMPPALKAAFDVWRSTEESRYYRLEKLLQGIVEDFRAATAAEQDSTGSTNDWLILASCVRHAAAICWYTLSFEMGEDPAPYEDGWRNSEIYLRSLYADLEKEQGELDGATGTPLYELGTGSPADADSSGAGTISYFAPPG